MSLLAVRQSRRTVNYYACWGAAVQLASGVPSRATSAVVSSVETGELSAHLESILSLLKPEDSLSLLTQLDCLERSDRAGGNSYLALVHVSEGPVILLGVDMVKNTPQIGLLLPLVPFYSIRLTGDGGFVLERGPQQQHIFKPISVQSLWTSIQYIGEQLRIAARVPQTCLDHYTDQLMARPHWHLMEDVWSRRCEADEEEEVKLEIVSSLREVMLHVDLDSATSKQLRAKLEEVMQADLVEYRHFIDNQILVVLRQMDKPAKIYDYLYLGSEWNALHRAELLDLKITHVVNITREVDNFYPADFKYMNVRVFDEETTDLLPHFEDVHNFITLARERGGRVLVHCRMGVSRSAACVVAHVMKERYCSLIEATYYVHSLRSCIKPNAAFCAQLEVYEGILSASHHRHSGLFNNGDAKFEPDTELKGHARSSSDIVDDSLRDECTELTRGYVRLRLDKLERRGEFATNDCLSTDIVQQQLGDESTFRTDGTEFRTEVYS